MTESIIISLISFCGMVVTVWAGIRKSANLTAFRLEQLEGKMDKHNCLIERMYAVEARSKTNSHRIEKIEGRIEHE